MSFTETAKKELAAKLSSDAVKSRSQAGRSLSYIESWHAIAEANRIFGFDGWSSETVDIKCVSERERKVGKPPNERDGWSVSYTAKVRVTVDGVVREGVGSGHGIDVDVGLAHESAIKECESDARKRALMTFGNPFGLALYDKTQANVGEAPKSGDEEEYTRADFALSTAPNKATLKALWDAILWDILNEEQTKKLTETKDHRLAELNAKIAQTP